METPEVEIGNDTGAVEESWEGLGDEDKEGVDERNKDEDKSEGEGEDTGGDLVSAIFS